MFRCTLRYVDASIVRLLSRHVQKQYVCVSILTLAHIARGALRSCLDFETSTSLIFLPKIIVIGILFANLAILWEYLGNPPCVNE